MHRPLQPEGWPRPAGYANGVVARGRTIFLAGQVGWNAQGRFESDDLVAQIAQALRNVAAILACDGAGPEHVTNLVWYFIDKREYINRLSEVGKGLSRDHGKEFSRDDRRAGLRPNRRSRQGRNPGDCGSPGLV